MKPGGPSRTAWHLAAAIQAVHLPGLASPRFSSTLRQHKGGPPSSTFGTHMSTPEITTILGQGSSFEGKLTFEGAVRIDGAFKGEIRTRGTLIVGETADVQAEIEGAHVVVHGAVQGDIRAHESVELRSPARVRGNIASPSLEIEKGARFDGNCVMADEAPVAENPPEPTVSDPDPEPDAEADAEADAED